MELVPLEEQLDKLPKDSKIVQRRNFDDRLENARRTDDELKLFKGKKKRFLCETKRNY